MGSSKNLKCFDKSVNSFIIDAFSEHLRNCIYLEMSICLFAERLAIAYVCEMLHVIFSEDYNTSFQ